MAGQIVEPYSSSAAQILREYADKRGGKQEQLLKQWKIWIENA